MATKAKKEIPFSSFISDIDPAFEEVITGIHGFLTGMGCGVSLQEAKSGHVVSFTHADTGKTIANFVSRKTGPVIRIYGDHAAQYGAFLETLPAGLQKKIAGASACRRLLDPTKCNSRCPMGYDFSLGDQRQIKCRHSCFMFPVTLENRPHIEALLQQELDARSAS